MSTFEQVDKTRCADVAEADWRALSAVLGSTSIRLSPVARKELVSAAMEARSWIPADRLAALEGRPSNAVRG